MVQGDRAALGDRLIVETEPIDLTGLKAGATKTVNVALPRGLRAIGTRRVSVTIRIEPISPPAGGGSPNP
jgi:YbbR domain-containing protein